jgi:hypothetical protein
MFLVTSTLYTISTIPTYWLLLLPCVPMGKVLVSRVQTLCEVVKINSYIQIFPICKCCMLPNCITNLHVGSVNLKQMYKLRAYFCSLKCVQIKVTSCLCQFKILSPNFYVFHFSIATYITLFFSANSHLGFAYTPTLGNLCYKLKI